MSKRESDLRSVIQKLLNLANDEGATEAEAKAALLKAKALMMKYHIEVKDESNEPNQEVESCVTEFTFSKRTEPWIISLASVIAQNSRCTTTAVYSSKRRRAVKFYGYEDDLNTCVTMFNYAMYCIWSKFPKIRQQLKEEYGYSLGESRPYTDSYAIGFISGLDEAFSEQYDAYKNQWGLVAVVPNAVVDHTYRRTNGNVVHYNSMPQGRPVDPQCFQEGHTDGLNWKPQQTISDHNS